MTVGVDGDSGRLAHLHASWKLGPGFDLLVTEGDRPTDHRAAGTHAHARKKAGNDE
jgi:hypothetical protein